MLVGTADEARRQGHFRKTRLLWGLPEPRGSPKSARPEAGE